MPTDDVLDLVRQYGEQLGAEGRGDLNAGRAADALFVRIAELLPQQPVQAVDNHDRPIWLHECNAITAKYDPTETVCWSCVKPGPWRPLLVAADSPPPVAEPAPEVETMCEASPDGRHCVHWYDDPEAQCCYERPASTDDEQLNVTALISDSRKIMKALGVDRPEDVLGAVRALFDMVNVREQQRDAARAESEKRLDALIKTRTEREDWQREAERLKRKVDAQPDPIVLRLPEVPEGTVALTGGNVHKASIILAILRGLLNKPLMQLEPGVIMRTLGDAQELLRVELAPPPAPEPRTAAEVWAGMSDDARDGIRSGIDAEPELTDALDREAGLTS